jgi:hypothetical protein
VVLSGIESRLRLRPSVFPSSLVWSVENIWWKVQITEAPKYVFFSILFYFIRLKVQRFFTPLSQTTSICFLLSQWEYYKETTRKCGQLYELHFGWWCRKETFVYFSVTEYFSIAEVFK